MGSLEGGGFMEPPSQAMHLPEEAEQPLVLDGRLHANDTQKVAFVLTHGVAAFYIPEFLRTGW